MVVSFLNIAQYLNKTIVILGFGLKDKEGRLVKHHTTTCDKLQWNEMHTWYELLWCQVPQLAITLTSETL